MNEQKYDELKKFLIEGQFPAGASEQEKYVLKRTAKKFEYDRVTNTIYYVAQKDKKRIVIRGAEEKNRIFKECHDSPFGGHAGRDNTIFKIKERYYWPGFYTKTEKLNKIKIGIVKLNGLHYSNFHQIISKHTQIYHKLYKNTYYRSSHGRHFYLLWKFCG